MAGQNDDTRTPAPRRSVHRYLPVDDSNFSIRNPQPDDPLANDPEFRQRRNFTDPNNDPADDRSWAKADLLKWARKYTPGKVGDPNDTLAKWKERTPYPARQELHKEVLHGLIRMFVGSYKQTATPDTPGLSKQEREDLTRGEHLKINLKEKWATERAAERFERDDRTIREAVNPSARSRNGAVPRSESKARTQPWRSLNISRATWYRRGQPTVGKR